MDTQVLKNLVRIIILQQRIEYVDTLKAIGILAVVLGHIASPLGSFIFSWHMPLFFVISGFFINFDLPFKNFILKDLKRLMVPYFFFSFLGVAIEILKRTLLDREMFSYIEVFKGVVYQMDIAALSGHYGHILWFLPTLFFARVLLYVIITKIEHLAFAFLFVICQVSPRCTISKAIS